MEQLTPEKIAQIKTVLKEIDINSANHSMIQDNKILFLFKEKWYRVRLPNQLEQTLAEQAQNKMQIRLASEPGNKSRNQLIKDLKENVGFDVAEKEKQQDKIKEELQSIYLEGAVIASEDVVRLEENYKKKDDIENRFMELTIELTEMLSPCIQEQAKIEYHRYLSYICTEEKVGDDFKATWKDYETYGKDGSGLTIKAFGHMQSLLLNIKEV